MKKIQTIISRLATGAIMLLLALSMTPAAHAQFTGTNGRIMWTTPLNGQYTIFPNGTNSNATGLATLTSYPGEWQAIYTPNGQYIVYTGVASSGAASNIYVTNAARTITPVAITSFTTCNVTDPASNSTGTKIAFACETSGGGATSEIYVIDLNISGNSISGSNQIQLTDQADTFNSFNPVWAPDNSVIYARNDQSIVTFDPTTPNQDTIVDEIFDVGTSTFDLNDVNPSGTTLLYARIPNQATYKQLFTVGVNGSGNAQLTSDNNSDYFGGYYSPDGTQVVSEKSPTNPSDQQLVLMTSAGASETVLYSLNNNGSPGVQNFRPFWSTDQNTYSDGNNGGTDSTPGVPNTTATKATKNSPVPWMLGGLLALMLAGLGGFWITKELKGKK